MLQLDVISRFDAEIAFIPEPLSKYSTVFGLAAKTNCSYEELTVSRNAITWFFG
jgi:hypothetical protein